jgi:uncharacterized membrane protein YfcA
VKAVIAMAAANILRLPVGSGRIAARLAAALLAVGVVAATAQLIEAPAADSAAAAVVLLAALVSSIAGFAFAALAGSALAWLRLEPVQAVLMMALCSIAIQAYAVWQLRASIRWRALVPMVAAGALTIPLGVALLVRIDPSLYAGVLGVIVTGYGGYALLRRQPRVLRGSPWRDAFVGALAGVIGGLASFPGLFVTIWCSLRGWDKVQQRAVYQPFILAMQLVTVACLGWAAPQHADLLPIARFVPFALLGAIGGLALFKRLTTGQFNAAVNLLLAVSGIGLPARAL